jgi:hypothetical protein
LVRENDTLDLSELFVFTYILFYVFKWLDVWIEFADTSDLIACTVNLKEK